MLLGFSPVHDVSGAAWWLQAHLKTFGVRRPGRIRRKAFGLAALVESVEKLRSLPPWSNPWKNLEFAALVESIDKFGSRRLGRARGKTSEFAALVESVEKLGVRRPRRPGRVRGKP